MFHTVLKLCILQFIERSLLEGFDQYKHVLYVETKNYPKYVEHCQSIDLMIGEFFQILRDIFYLSTVKVIMSISNIFFLGVL